MPRVVIVHAVARPGGSSTRVAWWREILALNGMEAVEVPLVQSGRKILPRGIGQLGSVATGRAAPEVLSWSASAARRAIALHEPDAVVIVTLRAYSPRLVRTLAPSMPVIIDVVDRLSESYRQRAVIDGRPLHRVAWMALSRAMARAEHSTVQQGPEVSAAGRGDAMELDAVWLPLTVSRARVSPDRPVKESSEYRWDALFTGTLDYPPNVAALKALVDTEWPEVQRLRPGTRLCVAGRRPTPEAHHLVSELRAELVSDFADYGTLAAGSALAISPLPLATGLQIKVLDAAAAGVPQVISPAAARGFAPGFAARVAPLDGSLGQAVVDLLDDPGVAAGFAHDASEQLRSDYSTECWAPQIGRLLAADGAGRLSDPLA